MPLVTAAGTGFLHLPKTGGTWVRYALARVGVSWRDEGRQHADHAEAVRACSAARYFTLVRHPLDWYASYWCMRMSEGWAGGGYNWLLPRACASASFAVFVRLAALLSPGFLAGVYARYAAPGVRVYRTEDLPGALPAALRDAGESFDERDLPAQERMNRGASLPGMAALCRYDAGTAAAVYESEAAVMERYGYARRDHPPAVPASPACGHCGRTSCRLCWLYDHDARYRALWGGAE